MKSFVQRAVTLCLMLVLLTGTMDVFAASLREERYIPARIRIAYEDRYLHFNDEALIIDGEVYFLADELKASLPEVGDLTQMVVHNGKEYVSARGYYSALGLIVIWDHELRLVRVYENMPVYANTPQNTSVKVLLYHHILRDSENVNFRNNSAVISEEDFETQMKYLYDNEYTTITLLQLHDFLHNNRVLPSRSVLITFDDGYYSNFTRAYPILKKYNQTAASFLITDSMSKEPVGEFDPDIIQYVYAGDLRLYSDVFEYATHTHDMHRYDYDRITVLSNATASEIFADLDASLAMVNNNLALAYPLGQYNDNVISLLKKTPIRLGFTTIEGAVESDSDPYQLKRYTIWPNLSAENWNNIFRQPEEPWWWTGVGF